MEKDLNRADVIYAFNEWMRRYIETPEEFAAEFKTVIEFLDEEAKDEEPSYGRDCTAYIYKVLSERS